MKPIEFPEVNCTYAKDQPEYLPLPVFKSAEPHGECISCWELTWRERIKLLFTGKMWLSMLTFHKPLTPVRPTVNKADLIHHVPTTEERNKCGGY